MEHGGTSKQKALGRGPRSRRAKRAAIRFLIIRTAARPIARRSATAKSVSGAAVSFMPKRFGRFIAQTSAGAALRCASSATNSLLCLKKPKGSFAAPPAFMKKAPQPDRASCKTRGTPWSRFQKERRGQKNTARAAATGCLNTDTSCSKSWVVSLVQERTYTTSTGNAMTTDLKTLSFGKSLSHAVFAQPITTAPGVLAFHSLAANASGIFQL